MDTLERMLFDMAKAETNTIPFDATWKNIQARHAAKKRKRARIVRISSMAATLVIGLSCGLLLSRLSASTPIAQEPQTMAAFSAAPESVQEAENSIFDTQIAAEETAEDAAAFMPRKATQDESALDGAALDGTATNSNASDTPLHQQSGAGTGASAGASATQQPAAPSYYAPPQREEIIWFGPAYSSDSSTGNNETPPEEVIVDPPKTDGPSETWQGPDVHLPAFPNAPSVLQIVPGWLPANFDMADIQAYREADGYTYWQIQASAGLGTVFATFINPQTLPEDSEERKNAEGLMPGYGRPFSYTYVMEPYESLVDWYICLGPDRILRVSFSDIPFAATQYIIMQMVYQDTPLPLA